MKILVWGINYFPEITGIGPYNTALCQYLHAQGHQVRMVTTFFYYPAWRKLPGDKGRLYHTEQLEGVNVHRCWHYVPARPSTLKRIAHEASFVFTSWLRVLSLPRPDVLVVVSPPLLLGAAAWVASRWKRSPYLFHVQDLQPDAALGLNMVRSGRLARVLYGLESLAYRKASRVSGISEAMLDAFATKGVPREKILLFPNGVDLAVGPTPRGRFRARQGYGESEFLVVYSGNMGLKQGLEILLEAAARIHDPAIRFVLCGDGAAREGLQTRRTSLNLDRVDLLPLQPEAQFLELLADTDLAVVPQQRGSGHCFFPSKLLRLLASSRPVLTVAEPNSTLARATVSGGFGVNLEPGHPEQLAAAVEALARDPESLRQMGIRGRAFVEPFDFQKVLSNLERHLRACAGRPTRAP